MKQFILNFCTVMKTVCTWFQKHQFVKYCLINDFYYHNHYYYNFSIHLTLLAITIFNFLSIVIIEIIRHPSLNLSRDQNCQKDTKNNILKKCLEVLNLNMGKTYNFIGWCLNKPSILLVYSFFVFIPERKTPCCEIFFVCIFLE